MSAFDLHGLAHLDRVRLEMAERERVSARHQQGWLARAFNRRGTRVVEGTSPAPARPVIGPRAAVAHAPRA